MIIYKATNLVNGKIYIGQTIQKFTKRISQHKCMKNSKCYFHNSLQKYGFNNFNWTIIDNAYNFDELDDKEIYWINFYNTQDKGYNLSEGGRVNRNMKRTKPSVLKGTKHTEERKEKNRQAQLERYKNNPYPEYLKEKMRKNMLNREITWGDKISDTKMGHTVNDETKAKISKTLQGNKNKFYWTFEKCKKTASEFNTKTNFRKKYPGAYHNCRINKWLNDFFPKTKK